MNKTKKKASIITLFFALISIITLTFSFTYAAYQRNTSTEQNVSIAGRKGFYVYLDATEWDIDGAIFYMFVWKDNSSGNPDANTPRKYLRPIGKTEEGYYIYNFQRTVHNRFLFLRTNPSAASSYFNDNADAFVSGVSWNKTANIQLYGDKPLIRIISIYGDDNFYASDGRTILGKISPHEAVAYSHIPAEHAGNHDVRTKHEILPQACEFEGYDDTIQYCYDCEHEISRSTTYYPAIGHNYVSSYQWKTGSSAVKEVRTCQNDKTHVIIDNDDAFSGKSTVSSYSISAGRKSELHHNGFTTKNCGDINFHFSNFHNGSDDPKGQTYFVNLKVHLTNTVSSKGLAIKIDNNYYYYYGNPNSGDSYAILKSDLSYSRNSGLSVTGRSDSLGNNTTISTLSSTLPFINDSEGYDALIQIYFSDVANRIVTVKITYYPSKAGRESFNGYYQTFTVQYTSNDFTNYNYVNSIRILRDDYTNTSMQIKEIEFNKYWIDRDVFSTGGNNGSTRYVIIDVNDYGY